MPIFKLNFIDQQFEGARIVLRQLEDLSPVQTALQQIEGEVPLSEIAKTLRQNLLPFYQKQDQLIQQLQLDLRRQNETCKRLEEQAKEWILDPLQRQITAANKQRNNPPILRRRLRNPCNPPREFSNANGGLMCR